MKTNMNKWYDYPKIFYPCDSCERLIKVYPNQIGVGHEVFCIACWDEYMKRTFLVSGIVKPRLQTRYEEIFARGL